MTTAAHSSSGPGGRLAAADAARPPDDAGSAATAAGSGAGRESLGAVSPSGVMRSLTMRLTAMFALCAALVFIGGGLLLHSSLQSAVDRQVREELELRAGLMAGLVGKTTSAANWEKLAAKLDDMASAQSGSRVWVVSGDAAFRHGTPPPGLAANASRPGFGSLELPEEHCALVTLTKVVPPAGERPELRLVVAKDPALFGQTMHRFRLALAAFVGLGVLLVAVLGYWIAKVGLRPLSRLSRQAQALSPQRPAQRLGLDPLPAELSDLTASFNGALARLERAYRQLEAFNADVAHELRTPLMNLIGQTQFTLTRPRPAEELAEVLHSNLEELERLRTIVNDMLFLARADQGALAAEASPVSLRQEVGRIVEFLEPLIDEAGVCVRIDGDERLPIEATLFQRAVTNLLHNAIQHSAAGDEIVVRIDARAGGASVSVSNRGALIPAVHLAHCFDRFYRADSSRTNSGENHGLGLAIVKAIATMHRGAVYARSEGGWNTFGFTLGTAA